MRPPHLLFAVLAILVAGCIPTPSASPIGVEEAVALVLAEDARFMGIGPRDNNLIGQAAWYEVTETDTGWDIEVRIGWGDCPAGCISEHRWRYAVTRFGVWSLVGEEGDPLPPDWGVTGTVTAGPTCPVVTDPPDPACADRPVAGAVLVVTDLAGVEVGRMTSDGDGSFALSLAPGAYRIEPQPVDGLMGTAAPVEFFVVFGEPPTEVAIGYDTGIR